MDLLILDEPTSGLDPLMEAEFRVCIAECRGAGRTVLLSSHILGEVDQVCDHVSIVRSGRTVQSGPLAAMRHLGGTVVEAETTGPVDGIDRLPGVSAVQVDGTRLRCVVDGAGLPGLLAALTRAGVAQLRCAPPTLEELFLRYYDSTEQAA